MNVRRLTTSEEISECIDRWNELHPTVPINHRLAEQRIRMPAPGVAVTVWGVSPDSTTELAGFAVTKRLCRPVPGYDDTTTAWLSLIAVDSTVTDVTEAGTALVESALDHLRSHGATSIMVGADIRKFFPALPSAVRDSYDGILREVGFDAGETLADLYCDLSTSSAREHIADYGEAPAGVDVRRARPSDELELHAFMEREFPGRWQFQVEANCAHPGGLEDYWIVTADDELVAFARTGTADSPVLSACVNWLEKWGPRYCGLGPIGVASDARGNGYGLLLIASVMEAFLDEGYHHMTIDGVADGLRAYYAKLGFEPALEFVAYHADL